MEQFNYDSVANDAACTDITIAYMMQHTTISGMIKNYFMQCLLTDSVHYIYSTADAIPN